MEVLIVLLIFAFIYVTEFRGKKKPQKAAPAEAIVTDDEESLEGVSLFDEEGCVGGSLPHEHEEGERVEEHLKHQEAPRRRDMEREAAITASEELQAMNLRRLRQAVVMAEILDKPRALRNRTRI